MTRSLVLVLCGLLWLAGAASPVPPTVPQATERTLDRASYVELARQWQDHIDRHGESAVALINLGLAFDYCEEREASLRAARRAVALEPDNPEALALLGKLLMIWEEDDAGARDVLQRCRAVAPDFARGLTLLATAHLRLGELDLAQEVFRTVFDRRILARPLQDYAYNMLVGLPPDAVLVAGGDSDTFPALALQAGLALRPDVVVLNFGLLNLPSYAKAIVARHPKLATGYDIDAHEVRLVDGRPTTLAGALIAAIDGKGQAPVYLAGSLDLSRLGEQPVVHNEGLCNRLGPSGLVAPEVARVMLEDYRLDSATDWTYPWSLAPNEARLMSNYVVAMVKLARDESLPAARRAQLLDRAEAIARFHELTTWTNVIAEMRGT